MMHFSVNWEKIQKSSIPVTINKLSDITKGSKIGPLGMIDDKLPLTNKDLPIEPSNPQKGKIDLPYKPDDVETVSQESEGKKNANSSKALHVEGNEIDHFLSDIAKQQVVEKPAKKEQTSRQADSLDNLIKTVMEKKTVKKQKNVSVKPTRGHIKGKGSQKSGGASALGELSVSAIAAFIEMIRPCWTIISVPRMEKINVRMEVLFDKQGFMVSYKVLNPRWSDPVYKTVANSATRAIADKRCQPFRLPLKDYSIWKKMVVNFCPTELI